MPSPRSTLPEVLTEALPIRPLFRAYLRGRTARKLPALKTVLVNHHTNSAPATIFKTTHHSSAAIHLYIGFCAHDIGGKRKRKIHSRTYRHIGIHAEQDAIGGNVLRLDRLPRNSLAGDSRLVDRRRRLQCHRQFYGKARRALHVRITPTILADFSNGFFGGFRHVCDDLPSG